MDMWKMAAVLVLGCVLAGCGAREPVASDVPVFASLKPALPEVEAGSVSGGTGALEKADPAPEPAGAVVTATRLAEQGHGDDAVGVLEAALSRNPFDLVCLRALVRVRRQLAKAAAEDRNLEQAAQHLDTGASAVALVRRAFQTEPPSDPSVFDRLSELQRDVADAADLMRRKHAAKVEAERGRARERTRREARRSVQSAMSDANRLYADAKGFWNDDEDRIIEALIRLDDVAHLLADVPISLRELYADVRIKCLSELGRDDEERYRVRTLLLNCDRER